MSKKKNEPPKPDPPGVAEQAHHDSPETLLLLKILKELRDLRILVLDNLTETRHISTELEGVKATVEEIDDDVDAILVLVTPPEITDFKLAQIRPGGPMAITGVQVGGTGVFQISLVPPNGAALQAGPTVSTDDTNVSLGPVDPNTLQFNATVASGDTNTTFNATVAGTNSLGNAITHTFSIPILQAPPPPITDFGLDQIS